MGNETFCCARFKDSVIEGKFEKAQDNDETEWFMPEWLHIYFCPFCGKDIKGHGFGNQPTTKQQARL